MIRHVQTWSYVVGSSFQHRFAHLFEGVEARKVIDKPPLFDLLGPPCIMAMPVNYVAWHAALGNTDNDRLDARLSSIHH